MATAGRCDVLTSQRFDALDDGSHHLRVVQPYLGPPAVGHPALDIGEGLAYQAVGRLFLLGPLLAPRGEHGIHPQHEAGTLAAGTGWQDSERVDGAPFLSLGPPVKAPRNLAQGRRTRLSLSQRCDKRRRLRPHHPLLLGSVRGG